jgi:hypothetical protein
MSRLAFCLTAAGRYLPPKAQRLLSAGGLQRPDYFARSARTPKDSIIAKWT